MVKTVFAVIGAISVTFHIARFYARYVEGKYARQYAHCKPATE